VTVLAAAAWGFSACSIPSQLDLKSIYCTETVILRILALAGVLSLPVDSLRDSPPHLRVREVKEWYVDYLVGMLLEEDGDHEDLTAPLLVIASVKKSEFRLKNMNRYTYEVHI